MTNKINGKVSFYMHAKKGDDITETSYETQGTLFKKNNKSYLFFEESNLEDNSKTKCRFEFDDEKIRIRRDGQIIIEQTYTTQKKMPGYIKTPYGELPTLVKTHRYQIINDKETKLVIGLAYDLFISEEKSGKYELKVQFDYNQELI